MPSDRADQAGVARDTSLAMVRLPANGTIPETCSAIGTLSGPASSLLTLCRAYTNFFCGRCAI